MPGIWTVQNKVRPDVYINFEGEGQSVGTIGERGVAAYPAPLSWGKEGITVIDAATYFQNSLKLIGFRAGDPRIRHITAAVNHAWTVLIYRVGTTGAVKATGTLGALTATAKYLGERGNDIAVAIEEDIDEEGKF